MIFGVGLGFGAGVDFGVGDGFGVGLGFGVLALRGTALQRYTVCPEAFFGRLAAFLTGIALPFSITTKGVLSELFEDALRPLKGAASKSAANESLRAARHSSLDGLRGIFFMRFLFGFVDGMTECFQDGFGPTFFEL